MESLQSIKESFINQLENSFSTIYTKENVIQMLEMYTKQIEEKIVGNPFPSIRSFTLTEIKNAIVKVSDYNNTAEFCEINVDTAELSMDYNNTVTLDSVEQSFKPNYFFDLLKDCLQEKE